MAQHSQHKILIYYSEKELFQSRNISTDDQKIFNIQQFIFEA
jgi:hypothetical protein